MQLVFRRNVEESASNLDKAGAALIKYRLVSDFYHGGIVVDGLLMHSTASKGLHCVPFNPEGWVVVDVGSNRDLSALDLFIRCEHAGYDWFSLLAFVLPWRVSDARRWYCFEWQWYCLTGELPTARVTPEKLLCKILDGVNLGK